MDSILNFNIGILGHVDSGKTSLAKALSTTASTAAFDKNPQSRERGITIDLGFSSFCIDAPTHIKESNYSKLQVTLVDCPGHASLIRTIIGGAQIIDGMILVIDVTKGFQTQTAECLVIGEILCKNLIVVLNKIDLIDESKRKTTIDKVTKKILMTLKNTKFANAQVIPASANSGSSDSNSSSNSCGIENLVSAISSMSYIPNRLSSKPFVFLVDHCFGIKGQGTIITGTVIQGCIAVNDNIEIPSQKIVKKVKSIQMFRQPVDKAAQGDRIGICVTQFDPKLLERSIAGACDYIKLAQGFIAETNIISYYKLPITSKSKFHICLGHDTILSKVTFFGSTDEIKDKKSIDFDHTFVYQSELIDIKKLDSSDPYRPVHQYALVEFERVVPLMPDSAFIASKLDLDVHTSMCRLSFWGKVDYLLPENYKTSILPNLKVYKDKLKEGTVERMNNDSELIVKNLLKKGTNIDLFIGLHVSLSTGESCVIDGTFGQSGKVKIRVQNDLKPGTKKTLKAVSDSKKKNKKNTDVKIDSETEPVKVLLEFRKYIFNSTKSIMQK